MTDIQKKGIISGEDAKPIFLKSKLTHDKLS